jgi:predicted nucleic acid-binding protein
MASEDKTFLDTNVALDHLADRQPFAEYAHPLFALPETGELAVCLSSLSFSKLARVPALPPLTPDHKRTIVGP